MKESEHYILCVDDDQDNLNLIKYVFEQRGFSVMACESLEECLLHIRENHFEAVILDNRFGDRSSLDVCRQIRFSNPTTPIVFCSGEARPAEIEKALRAGGNAYLVKPTDFDELTEIVIDLIQKKQSEL